MISIDILLLTLAVNTVLVHSHCPGYLITTDDIQIAFNASIFAYKNEAEPGNMVPDSEYKIVHAPIDVFNEGGEGVKLIIAEYKQTTVIAFRGTQTHAQLLQELLSVMHNRNGEKIKFANDTATIVSFFWRGFMILYDNIESYLNDETRKYIITGHSLGGAMASILAIVGKERHSIWNHPESCLITFGQPRVGDAVYARKHDEMIDSFRKLRFVNELDPFPHIIIPLSPPAVHHSREVWMSTGLWSRKKYWKICHTGESYTCSKLFRLIPNRADHSSFSYGPRIRKLSNTYQDKYGNTYPEWKEAMQNSCSRSSASPCSQSHLPFVFCNIFGNI